MLVAARDLQRRLTPPTDSDRAFVQEMIRDIKGENVVPAVKAAMDKTTMPERSQGSYLVRKDIDRIKKFLVSLVKTEASSDEPSEAQK